MTKEMMKEIVQRNGNFTDSLNELNMFVDKKQMALENIPFREDERKLLSGLVQVEEALVNCFDKRSGDVDEMADHLFIFHRYIKDECMKQIEPTSMDTFIKYSLVS